VLLTNTPGVLDKEGNLITGITPKQIDDMVADGTLSGGMLPKLARRLMPRATVSRGCISSTVESSTRCCSKF
jgi:acetylglutamate kinase